jgi:tetratricopeptide (TPR) repeat protein
VAPLVALLLALGAGGVVAALELGRSSDPRERVVVRTVTGESRTVRETVTVSTTVSAEPPPPAAEAPLAAEPPPPSTKGPHTLNDSGYALMQKGRYEAALPLLRAAVRGLAGRGPSDPYEGWANYNLGYTLVRLGSCEEALPYLHRSLRLQPGRGEVLAAIRHARACA